MTEENLFERIYPELFVDEAEYFRREELTSHRHEWLRGRMRHLPLGGYEHATICGNFRAQLSDQLPHENLVTGSQMRIWIEATGLRTYADVLLITPQTHFVREGNESDTSTNPMFLAEVSDQSTETYDRTTKWDHYRQISSLRDYVIVSAQCVRVEHFALCGDEWTFQVYDDLNDVFVLPFLDVQLSLEMIYKKTNLPSNFDFWKPIAEGIEQ